MLSEVGLDTQEADTRIGRPFDNGPEEEGNLSDPGPVTSYKAKESVNAGALSYKKDGERERERLLARRRMILDRSVRETRMVQSVDDEELRRLVLQEQDIREARKELADLQNRMNDLLSREPFVSERRHSMRALSLQKLQGDKSKSKGTKEIAECQCRSKREALDRRRTHVKEARGILQMKEEALRQSKTGHLLDLEVHRSILLSASQRRANLISDLSNIFPVELVDAANVLFSICGIPLPNGDFESQISLQSSTGPDLDEDHVSSALGYVAQAVQLLAAYLTIPLYYPIRCMGSRSLVQDPISQMKGPKIFPLYSRGVDRYRFEYAVFLLNKDIEQIMLEHSIGVMDLTQTLPNLKNIYLTLSSDVTSG